MSMIQLSEPKTLAEMRAAHRRRQAKFFQPIPRVTFPPTPRPEPKHQGPIESWFDLTMLDGSPVPVGDRYALSKDEWEMIRDMRARDTYRPSLNDIMALVTKTYNVGATDLRSKRRTQELARPRHIICYLAKTLTLKSLPEIGRFLGGRDHTTILSSVRRATKLLLDGKGTLKAEIDLLTCKLMGRPE